LVGNPALVTTNNELIRWESGKKKRLRRFSTNQNGVMPGWRGMLKNGRNHDMRNKNHNKKDQGKNPRKKKGAMKKQNHKKKTSGFYLYLETMRG